MVFLYSRKSKLYLARFIIILIIGIFLIGALKEFVKRPRPYYADSSIIPTFIKTDYSFPSRHTFISFLTYLVVIPHLKKYRKLFTSYLVFILPISYIIMGFHYPSDIITGAAIAIIINYFLSVNIFKGLWKRLH